MGNQKSKSVSNLVQRPRRNRASDAIRRLVRETVLEPQDFILPLFLIEGEQQRDPIAAMPGCFRFSPDLLLEECRRAYQLGVPAVALFPVIPDGQKDSRATEALNPDGLLPATVRMLKEALPELLLITDVALDPYSSDGHDGLVESGQIVNDATLEVLTEMALTQARAGADIVAPSDMMDGRVAAMRTGLDQNGFEQIGIMAYSAKYASAFYGPFRDALDSAPRHGDKKTYQMDPANSREALREVALDVEEGADIVMVKPALAYLDVIRAVKESTTIPVAAYNVSGEYSMVKAAAQQGWLDESAVMNEMVTSIKRAGADMILTYFAMDLAQMLNGIAPSK